MTTFVENASWNSIYIPTIPQDITLGGKSCTTIEALTDFFENKACFGKVRRIDLITKPRGNYTLLAAFVHFDEWYPESNRLRDHLNHPNTTGEFKLAGYYEPELDRYVSFCGGQKNTLSRFLTIKINKTPIPEVSPMEASELNIHQLVHSIELARETIANNEKLIAEQAVRIAELEQLLADK
jgi:hypothetical protein